ncbi:MAG: hypothetical protein GC204_16320 [Chloroflexi bacterium]|nr:hypothetical protein [Chloroflexota bacterium]
MPKWIVQLLVVLAVSIALVGCGTIALPATPAVQAKAMPEFVHKAAQITQEAYHYAAAHPHELEQYPCYCGCVHFDHASLRDCFIKTLDDTGSITLDDHAAGCGICVLIAQDVIRLSGEGQSPGAIRAYIDAHYEGFGPSTNTPLPAA